MEMLDKQKVLIVDDREANLSTLEILLEPFDIDIIRALSGEEALEKMMKYNFSLILIDVEMPILSGFETVKLMRKVEKTKFIPVIFISAVYSNEYYRNNGLDTGAADFIIKPIGEEIFQSKVNVFLQIDRQRIELNEELERNKLMNKIIDDQKEHLKFVNQILRHDLLNYITAINSAIRLVKLKKDEKYYQEAESYIKKSVALINKMKQLEDFNEMDSNHTIKRLKSIIEDICESYSNIEITITGDSQILVDGSITSMIDNVISNASLHSQGDKLEIDISKNQKFVKIRIADNGIGIPDEIKNKIFQQNYFYGKTGHSGIGLHISKRIANLYGGNIIVEDNIPNGAVFIIHIKN